MPHAPEAFHHRAFRFACGIVHLYTKLASTSGVPSHLARQILRAGTSIGANLEEARGAQTRRDVTAKFSIALTEARETAYWLRLLDSTGLAPQELIHPILSEAEQLNAILTTARRRLHENGG